MSLSEKVSIPNVGSKQTNKNEHAEYHSKS